jgi:hypothetical protein
MFAAAEGKSTLGIPKSVGKEFADSDPGGKLPEKAKPDKRKPPSVLHDHPSSVKSRPKSDAA